MKLSTFVRHIKDYQYAEYGTDLIGKIRLINSTTIELETKINNCGWDFITRFCNQIEILAGEIQYQVSRGVNVTGCEINMNVVSSKSKKDGICKQRFEVRIG